MTTTALIQKLADALEYCALTDSYGFIATSEGSIQKSDLKTNIAVEVLTEAHAWLEMQKRNPVKEKRCICNKKTHTINRCCAIHNPPTTQPEKE